MEVDELAVGARRTGLDGGVGTKSVMVQVLMELASVKGRFSAHTTGRLVCQVNPMAAGS